MSNAAHSDDNISRLQPFFLANALPANQLCDVCQKIDIPRILVQVSGDAEIGTLAYCRNQHDCPLCRLVCAAFRAWCPDDNHESLNLTGPFRCFISSGKSGKEQISAADHCQLVLAATDSRDKPDSRNGGQIISSFDLLKPQQGVNLNCSKENSLESSRSLPLDSRRVVGSLCDFELLRSWLHQCKTSHQHSQVRQPFDNPLIIECRLRALDVTTISITTLDADCRYTALSYVCGEVTGLALAARDASCAESGGPARFKFSMFPTVIHDAIDLTKRMGERFLWIDCLCIRQYDAEDLSILIRNVNSVYEHAVFTIIAASGSGAQASLPGISPRSRRDVSPTVETIPCRKGAFQLALSAFSAQDMLSRSKWATRGWTYQEHVLSPRSLCFTPTECFFTCDQGIWREAYHTNGEYRSSVKGESAYGFRRRKISSYFRHTCQRAVYSNEGIVQYSLSRDKEQQSFPEYFQAVHDYTARTLGYPSDIINAFAGMLRTFDSQDILQHGLPLRFFEQALCWVETDEAEFTEPGTRLCRRFPMRSDSTLTDDQRFPSWSWAHWKASVTYDIEHSWEGYLSLFAFDQTSVGSVIGTPRKQPLYYKCSGYGDRLFQPVGEMQLPASWSWRLGTPLPPTPTPSLDAHKPVALALWSQCLRVHLKYCFIQRRDDFRKYYEAYEATTGKLLGLLKLFSDAVMKARVLRANPSCFGIGNEAVRSVALGSNNDASAT